MKKTILFLFLITALYSCGGKTTEKANVVEIKKVETGKILALGDSLTAGYGLDIGDSYPSILENILEKEGYNYEVINAGVSGDTSKNLVGRLHLYTDHYDTILLNIGGNDGLRSLSTNDLKENILTTIDNFPNSNIVLFSIDLPFNYGSTYRKRLKKVYEDVSDEKDVYFYGLFFKGLDYNKHFLSDKIHPNKEGYNIISKNIISYLVKNNIIKND